MRRKDLVLGQHAVDPRAQGVLDVIHSNLPKDVVDEEVRADAVANVPPLDTFARRHIGPDALEEEKMLAKLGYKSMADFVADAVPNEIRVAETDISSSTIPALSELELHYRAKELADENKPFKSYIGMGYHNAVVPPVILRNVRLARCLKYHASIAG